MSDHERFGNVSGSAGQIGGPPHTSSAINPGFLGQAGEQSGMSGGSVMDQAEGAAGTVQEKAGQALDTAKEKMSQVTDQATTKVDAGMDKAAGGLETIAETIRDKGQAIGGEGGGVQSAVGTAADKLDSAAQYLRDKDTDQLMTELEGLVRRKPVESMVVAAAVGFVLSKVLR